LNAAQEEALKAFVSTTLPRSTRQIGAFIAQEFGLVYESRSGLAIAARSPRRGSRRFSSHHSGLINRAAYRLESRIIGEFHKFRAGRWRRIKSSQFAIFSSRCDYPQQLRISLRPAMLFYRRFH
jgi:hypothetical protein